MKLSDIILENLWDKLENIPFNEDNQDGLVLATKFYYFEKGTPRNYIWNWFDVNHSKGVSHLMYNRIN